MSARCLNHNGGRWDTPSTKEAMTCILEHLLRFDVWRVSSLTGQEIAATFARSHIGNPAPAIATTMGGVCGTLCVA